MRGDATLMVSDDDTAIALGTGIIRVLASARLIALCEEAAVNAVANDLADGTTTVSMRVQFDHLQPTPVAAAVNAEAVLKKVDGRRLTFEVSAFDSGGLVAAGKITRVVVAIDRFMAKCCPPGAVDGVADGSPGRQLVTDD